MHRIRLLAGVVMLSFIAPGKSVVRAQRATIGPAVRQFVAVDTTVVALVHAGLIDGTGAPARVNQTVIVRDGNIAAVGAGGSIPIPAGALVMDLTGKTIIPGMIMMHEHLFYPTVSGSYGYVAESFVRLYLAGGVTGIRTGGTMNGFSDMNISRSIASGQRAGPWIDATAPYINAGNVSAQTPSIHGPEGAAQLVNYWADQGATSFKAYMFVTRAELAAAINAAHARGLKVTGHLCSVTLREAAELGIDNLEHTLMGATDFVPGKKPDTCPGQTLAWANVADQDVKGERVQSLMKELIRRNVALTSTLSAIERLGTGRLDMTAIEVLDPILKESLIGGARGSGRGRGGGRSGGGGGSGGGDGPSTYERLFRATLAASREFVRLGGLLMVGTDPSVPGIIPGYANQREIELLVQAGFTMEEAIRIGSLNAAIYLGRSNRVGSIAAGKQADLVVINGDPTTTTSAIRDVHIVFKQGVGYDPARLIASVKGRVGLF